MLDSFQSCVLPLAQYHKAYSSQEEYDIRLRIFIDNLRVAEELQRTGTSTHGVTQFMDLTPEEFKSMYTGVDIKALRAALGDLPVAQVRNCCVAASGLSS